MDNYQSINQRPLILGIGGTTRLGSSSEKALVTCMDFIRRTGARTELFLGPALDLPTYAPERPQRSEAALQLVAALRRCDGLVISSPSYHGGISGMLKNAIDYTEDLRTDERSYLDEVPVGLIACGGGWQGASNAMSSLRAIAHSLRAWPTPFGAVLNTSLPLFDAAGKCTDGPTLDQLLLIGKQVLSVAKTRAIERQKGDQVAFAS